MKIYSEAFSKVIGKKFTVTISPKGKVKGIKGLKEIIESLEKKDQDPTAQKLIEGSFDENKMKSNYGIRLSYLPRWSGKSGGFMEKHRHSRIHLSHGAQYGLYTQGVTWFVEPRTGVTLGVLLSANGRAGTLPWDMVLRRIPDHEGKRSAHLAEAPRVGVACP